MKPQINDIVQITVYTQMGEQAGLNVRHFKVTDVADGGTDLEDFVGAMGDLLKDAYKDVMNGNASYLGVGGKVIFGSAMTDEVYSVEGADTGTVDGDGLPSALCGMITLTTGLAGRANRGRMYIPFPAELHNGPDGKPTSDYQLLLQDIGVVFATPHPITEGSASTEYTPIVWQRALSAGVTITDHTVRPKWGTQHRRGDYGTPNLPTI